MCQTTELSFFMTPTLSPEPSLFLEKPPWAEPVLTAIMMSILKTCQMPETMTTCHSVPQGLHFLNISRNLAQSCCPLVTNANQHQETELHRSKGLRNTAPGLPKLPAWITLCKETHCNWLVTWMSMVNIRKSLSQDPKCYDVGWRKKPKLYKGMAFKGAEWNR